MSEKIWYQDLSNFLIGKNYNVFFPSSEMTFTAQLNALQRLALYFSVIMYVIKQDANVFFVLGFMSLFTFLLYNLDTKNKVNEKLFLESNNLKKDSETGEVCYKPNEMNPFMNVLMSDYSQNTQRPRACNVSDPTVKQEVNKHFEKNLYRDISDIFQKNSSDRQWVTNPITTIPNDQGKFAEWLYGTGPTCKESSGEQCYRNIYRRIQT